MSTEKHSPQIETFLPFEAIDLVNTSKKLAEERGQRLFLVGGAVRDILLCRPVDDIDLALEGNAIDFAQKLSSETGFPLVIHPEFMTARIETPKCKVDLAGTRSEHYSFPGALPKVLPDTILSDLKRRDFTINALAISLCANNYGQLIDEFDGASDVKKGIIRVLHPNSFRDDATRIWRAIRYEQRLSFIIEEETMALLKRDMAYLSSISPERLWYELKCVLKESIPEKALLRASEINLLGSIHPCLKYTKQITNWFRQSRKEYKDTKPPEGLYLALLLSEVDSVHYEEIIKRLNLNKPLSSVIRDYGKLKTLRTYLDYSTIVHSMAYRLLHGLNNVAIQAMSITAPSANIRKNLRAYSEKHRYVKVILNGKDLISIGFKPGPSVSKALNLILYAKIDGRISSHEDEIALARQLLAKTTA